MKKVLVTTTISTVLLFGCRCDDDDTNRAPGTDSGASATAATEGTAQTGGTAPTGGASPSGGVSGGGAGASAGVNGKAADACPGGVASEDLIIEGAAKLAELVHCSKLKTLAVMGADVASLNALSNVTTIEGNLLVQDTSLADLEGLNSLTSVKGDLYIGASLGSPVPSVLTSLKGLEKLTTVGGNLLISNNPALADISALSNLASIGSGKWLTISHNPSLATCDAQGLAIQLGLDLTDPNSVVICSTQSDECGGVVCQRI